METEKSEIRLEPGGGERVVLSFRLGGQLYGFDVTGAEEVWITAAGPVKPLAEAGPAVEGVLRLRGQVAFVVDLPEYLSGTHRPLSPRDLFLAVRLRGGSLVVYRVQAVAGIDYLTSREIRGLGQGEGGISAGTALCGGDEVALLDMEKIAEVLLPGDGQDAGRKDREAYEQ